MFNISEREEDLLKVAAIAHDIRKHTDSGGYVKDHAHQGALFIKEIYDKHSDLLSFNDAVFIAKAIASHMGVWGEPAPVTDGEKILHISDYIASRKAIMMDFGIPVSEKSVTEVKEKQPVLDPKDYIIEFGKHAGKTIEEIAKTDRKYLIWVSENKDFGQKEAQENIIKYLEK